MGHTPCPSLPKHNLSMQQTIFSLQIEDTLQPASNQTGVNDENSSEDEGPDFGGKNGSCGAAGSDAEQANGADVVHDDQ